MEKIILKGNVVLSDEVWEGGVVVLEGERIATVYSLKENRPEFCAGHRHLLQPFYSLLAPSYQRFVT